MNLFTLPADTLRLSELSENSSPLKYKIFSPLEIDKYFQLLTITVAATREFKKNQWTTPRPANLKTWN